MIMIFDVDVTAERRHYNTHRPAGDTATLSAAGAVKPTNPTAQWAGQSKEPSAPQSALNPAALGAAFFT